MPAAQRTTAGKKFTHSGTFFYSSATWLFIKVCDLRALAGSAEHSMRHKRRLVTVWSSIEMKENTVYSPWRVRTRRTQKFRTANYDVLSCQTGGRGRGYGRGLGAGPGGPGGSRTKYPLEKESWWAWSMSARACVDLTHLTINCCLKLTYVRKKVKVFKIHCFNAVIRF